MGSIVDLCRRAYHPSRPILNPHGRRGHAGLPCFVRCGAKGAITGVGNAIPKQILRLVELCEKAATGCVESRRLAKELDDALAVLSRFDEGPDLVLYYKRLMVLAGNTAYEHQINSLDRLSESQRVYIDQQWNLFMQWWTAWSAKN